MTSHFPLQTVLDLMKNRADDAAKALGRLIAAEKDAKTRVTLLEGYRAEYTARFRVASEAGITPQQWANFQDFLGKLDEAIAQQTRIALDSAGLTVAGQQRWLGERNRVKAFDTLAKKHATGVRYEEGRQEQKQVDELSARRHRLKAQDT